MEISIHPLTQASSLSGVAGGGGGGGGGLNKVFYGEALPLPFYIPFLSEKVPVSYTSIETCTPSIYL